MPKNIKMLLQKIQKITLQKGGMECGLCMQGFVCAWPTIHTPMSH